MTDKELYVFLRDTYKIRFAHSYIHFINNFSTLDSGLKDYQVHHICPRCCGGNDDERNMIKVSFHHHRKLHQLILQTKELTKTQRKYLTFAYRKMCKN